MSTVIEVVVLFFILIRVIVKMTTIYLVNIALQKLDNVANSVYEDRDRRTTKKPFYEIIWSVFIAIVI